MECHLLRGGRCIADKGATKDVLHCRSELVLETYDLQGGVHLAALWHHLLGCSNCSRWNGAGRDLVEGDNGYAFSELAFLQKRLCRVLVVHNHIEEPTAGCDLEGCRIRLEVRLNFEKLCSQALHRVVVEAPVRIGILEVEPTHPCLLLGNLILQLCDGVLCLS